MRGVGRIVKWELTGRTAEGWFEVIPAPLCMTDKDLNSLEFLKLNTVLNFIGSFKNSGRNY